MLNKTDPPAGASASTTPPAAQKPQAGAEPPKKTAEKTPPDLSGISEFVSRQLEGIKVTPQKPKKEPEEDDTTPDKTKAKAKDKGQQPPPKKKVAPVLPPKTEAEPLSEERIAKAAAAGVAEVLDRRGKPKEQATEEKVEPAQERKVTVLKRMEDLYPDKYKDISKRYLQSVRKLKEYAQQWEAQHPGEDFDESAEEHEAFFAENDVEWQDEDYTEAIADMRADKRVEEVNKSTNEKLSSLEKKERLREAAPEIDSHQVSASRRFWDRMGEQYKDFVNPTGAVDRAKAEALQKADPIGYDLRLQAAVRLENEVAAIYRLMNGLEDYNERNAMHNELGKFAEQQERALAARPDEDKLDAQGRRFLPAAEYHKIPKRDADRYYWTFTVADLGALRAAEIAAQTEKIVSAEDAKFQKWAAARGIKLPDKSGAAHNGEAGEGEEDLDETDEKPLSPSGGVEPKMAAVAAAAAGSDSNPLSSFVARQIGKR